MGIHPYLVHGAILLLGLIWRFGERPDMGAAEKLLPTGDRRVDVFLSRNAPHLPRIAVGRCTQIA
jgi:hypothetical protein